MHEWGGGLQTQKARMGGIYDAGPDQSALELGLSLILPGNECFLKSSRGLQGKKKGLKVTLYSTL